MHMSQLPFAAYLLCEGNDIKLQCVYVFLSMYYTQTSRFFFYLCYHMTISQSHIIVIHCAHIIAELTQHMLVTRMHMNFMKVTYLAARIHDIYGIPMWGSQERTEESVHKPTQHRQLLVPFTVPECIISVCSIAFFFYFVLQLLHISKAVSTLLL